jgi:hypothetical protein
MSEATSAKKPTLAEIRDNLLEVRNHAQFNIGSPAAIDHLLVSLVCVIDALQEAPPHPPTVGEGE